MNDAGIKAIIFDLGNVWVDFDHMISARKISSLSQKKPEEIFELFFDSGITSQFEEGRISPRDFFSRLQKMLDLKISYDQFIPIWNEIFFLSDRNIKTHNLAKLLKQKYTLAMLSNINVLHFEYLTAKFPVFQIFNKIMLSYQLHLRKPDHKIYKKVLKILNLNPQDVIYIDDRHELTKEAEILGIRSFHFQDPDKLKEDFLRNGINIG